MSLTHETLMLYFYSSLLFLTELFYEMSPFYGAEDSDSFCLLSYTIIVTSSVANFFKPFLEGEGVFVTLYRSAIVRDLSLPTLAAEHPPDTLLQVLCPCQRVKSYKP